MSLPCCPWSHSASCSSPSLSALLPALITANELQVWLQQRQYACNALSVSVSMSACPCLMNQGHAPQSPAGVTRVNYHQTGWDTKADAGAAGATEWRQRRSSQLVSSHHALREPSTCTPLLLLHIFIFFQVLCIISLLPLLSLSLVLKFSTILQSLISFLVQVTTQKQENVATLVLLLGKKKMSIYIPRGK